MELEAYLDRKDEFELIDVREDDEWRAGHIAESRHIPLGRLADRLGDLPKDRSLITVCRTGPRSERAAKTLAEAGYSADFLAGGVTAWAAGGQALVDDDGKPGGVDDPGADPEPMEPELETLQTNFLEIAMALNERFGGREPTDEESKAFMREWLEGKGTPAEEIDRILSD
jgi:rhodanese-related sulfurtransferase